MLARGCPQMWRHQQIVFPDNDFFLTLPNRLMVNSLTIPRQLSNSQYFQVYPTSQRVISISCSNLLAATSSHDDDDDDKWQVGDRPQSSLTTLLLQLLQRPAGTVQTPPADPADPGTTLPRGHKPLSLSLPALTADFPGQHQPQTDR